jgi:hypothetical protein
MEVIKCKFILISKLANKHKYFLYFLLGSLFRVVIPDILKAKYDKEDIDNNSLNYLLTQKYIEIMRNIISDLFLGFFHCYNKIKNKDDPHKRQIQTTNTKSLKINYIFNVQSSRFPLTLKYIFLISVIDIISQILIPLKFIIEYNIPCFKTILNTETLHFYILLFFDIFARYFFSRWLLKTYFYAHHKFSFLLNVIGLFFIGVIDLGYKSMILFDGDESNKKKFDLLYITILSIQTILYSFEDIMNKLAFIRLAILPSTLLFYNSLFLLLYFILISLLFFIFDLYDFKTNFDFMYEIRYSICYIPFNILRNYNILNVIDKFSAQHMTFLRVSEAIIFFLYIKISVFFELRNRKSDYPDFFIIVQSIGFVFLFVSTLIHNEIIIINHPVLKAKTAYFLDKDADREQVFSFYTDTCLSDSIEESMTHSNLCNDIDM